MTHVKIKTNGWQTSCQLPQALLRGVRNCYLVRQSFWILFNDYTLSHPQTLNPIRMNQKLLCLPPRPFASLLIPKQHFLSPVGFFPCAERSAGIIA